jgi:hypothetical protein
MENKLIVAHYYFRRFFIAESYNAYYYPIKLLLFCPATNGMYIRTYGNQNGTPHLNN